MLAALMMVWCGSSRKRARMKRWPRSEGFEKGETRCYITCEGDTGVVFEGGHEGTFGNVMRRPSWKHVSIERGFWKRECTKSVSRAWWSPCSYSRSSA